VLNGQNYDDWKLRCTAFFKARKLTQCITTSPDDRERILAETESKEADRWEQDEADAVYYLLTTLGKDDTPVTKWSYPRCLLVLYAWTILSGEC